MHGHRAIASLGRHLATRVGQRWPRGWRWLVILALAVGLVAGAIEAAIRASRLPAKLEQPRTGTPVIADLRGRTIAVVATPFARESYPMRLRDMGAWLPLVTVGIEDARFWTHPGVDFRAATGAFLRNLVHGRIVSGASTITQQLIKISSDRDGRTLSGKIHEALAALQLERRWDKPKILETYLNRIDYGNRRIGPEAAARAYFNKPACELSLAEAIFLAGLPQSPTRLNPWKNPQTALERYRRNVARLAKAGLLPADASAESLFNKPPQVGRFEPPNEAPHFARMVAERLRERANNSPAASPIVTSLDLDLQRLATRIVRDHLSATVGLGVGDAAIVVLENSTGAVRAFVSAGDPGRGFINSAIEPRSCGSTLKPFLYLSAIDQRKLTAASLLPDTPDAISEEYRDYDPQNYSQRHLGPVRVREALGSSLNVPAVFALSRLGARQTFEYLRSWGLNFPGSFDSYGAGFILGNAPVRLLELAGAYAALARGGVFWAPRLKTTDPIESRRLGSVEGSAIVADILCDNRARMASFGASSPLNLPERTAVKTGTSSGFRDGWCVGFNRDHTVAVWAGNLDGRPMAELLAVRSAAPLWAALMASLYANGDRPWPELQESATLHAVDVAAETGLLPRLNEPVVREWFLPGTEPVEHASAWYVDGVLQLPAEYHAWCAGPHSAPGATAAKRALKILFPKDGATFSLNPALSKAQQMLPLQSSLPECEWFLNGEKIHRPLIPLERGKWTISAHAQGQVAGSNSVVE
ncbi:MAG TPA: transglycosylase domain-containing protein [Terrimicrobiaceae bacterium]